MIHVSQTRNWSKVKFEHTIFRLVVALFKADQSTTAFEHRTALVVQYFACVACICNFENMLNIPFRSFVWLAFPFFIMSILFSLAYTALLLYCIIKHPEITFSDRVPPSFSVAVRAGYLSKKVVFPVAVWSYFTLLLLEEVSTLWVVLGAIGLALSALLAIGNILLVCNTFPSLSIIASFNHGYQAHAYVSLIAVNILGLYGQHRAAGSIKIVLAVLVITVEALLATFYCLNKNFWNKMTNIWFLNLQFYLVIFSIWNLMNILGYSLNDCMPEVLVAFSMGAKICNNAAMLRTLVNPFQPNLDSQWQTYGLTLTEKLLASKRRGEILEKAELEALCYYESLLKQHLDSNPDRYEPDINSVTVLNDRKCFYRWIVRYIMSQRPDYQMLGFCLKVNLLNIFDNLVILLQLMTRFEAMCKHSFRTRLEFFHLKSLYEAKIKAFYNLAKDDTVEESSLYNQYSLIILQTSQCGQKSLSDISTPLEHKRMFEHMQNSIKEIVYLRISIFDFVTTSRLKSNSVDGHKIMKLNSKARKHIREFDKFLDEKINKIRLPPTYFFGLLKIYYRMLKYDGYQARKCLNQYRTNKAVWDIRKGRQQTLGVDILDSRAVVMNITVQGGLSGTIIDISPGGEQLLGLPFDGRIIGHNVNELFVDVLAKRHQELMLSSAGIDSLLNTRRDFFLRTFSAKLLETSFLLKLIPYVDRDVVIVAALNPRSKIQSFLVLLDNQNNILEAEDGFWISCGLKDIKNRHKLNHIEKLSRKVALMIELVKTAKKVLNETKKGTMTVEQGSSLQQLCLYLTRLIALNDHQKILYGADEYSPVYNTMKDISMSIRIDFINFNQEIELTKLFVTFSSKDVVMLAVGANLSSQFLLSTEEIDEHDDNDVAGKISPEERLLTREAIAIDRENATIRFRTSKHLSIDTNQQSSSKFVNDKYEMEELNLESFCEVDSLLQELCAYLSDFSDNALSYLQSSWKDSLIVMTGVVQACIQEGLLKNVRTPQHSLRTPQHSLKTPSMSRIKASAQTPTIFSKKMPSSFTQTSRAVLASGRLARSSQVIPLGATNHSSRMGSADNMRTAEPKEGKPFVTVVSMKESDEVEHNIKMFRENTQTTVVQNSTDPEILPAGIWLSYDKKSLDKAIRDVPSKKSVRSSALTQGKTTSNIEVKGLDDPAESSDHEHTKKIKNNPLLDKRKKILKKGIALETTTNSNSQEESTSMGILNHQRTIGAVPSVLATLMYGVYAVLAWIFFEAKLAGFSRLSESVHRKSSSLQKVSFHMVRGITNLLEKRNLDLVLAQNITEVNLSIRNCCEGTDLAQNLVRYITEDKQEMMERYSELWLQITQADSINEVDETDRILDKRVSTSLTRPVGKLLMMTDVILGAVNGIYKSSQLDDWLSTESNTAPAELVLEKTAYRDFIEDYLVNDIYFTLSDSLQDTLIVARHALISTVYPAYDRQMVWLGVILGCLVFCNAIVSGTIISKLKSRMNNVLESYCCLRERDINFETRILKNVSFYLQHDDAYNADMKMEEARLLVSGGDLNQEVSKEAASSLQSSNMFKRKKPFRIINTESESHTLLQSKIVMSRPFRSLLVFAVLIMTAIATLILDGWLMYSVHSKVRNVSRLRLINLQGEELMQDLNLRFSKLSLLSPLMAKTNPSLIEKLKTDLTEDGYRQSVSALIQLYQFDSSLLEEDACALLIDERYPSVDVDMCRKLAHGFGSQGIIKLVIYEQEVYTEALNRLHPLLEDPYKASSSSSMETNFKIWFDPLFLDQRVAHFVVFHKACDALLQKVGLYIAEKNTDADLMLKTFRLVCILIAVLPFLLILPHAVFLLKKDWWACLHTFEVISPETIMANQYVLVKYKLHSKKYGL